MGSTVRIPAPLRKITGGNDTVEVEGRTVREVIENLEREYPGIKERICDANGGVRSFVNIFVNEEDIRFLNRLETEIRNGDEISIIPAIAGGRGG